MGAGLEAQSSQRCVGVRWRDDVHHIGAHLLEHGRSISVAGDGRSESLLQFRLGDPGIDHRHEFDRITVPDRDRMLRSHLPAAKQRDAEYLGHNGRRS